MASHARNIRTQVQDIVKQAAGRFEGARAELLSKVGQKLVSELLSLKGRRAGLLRSVSRRSATLAQQQQVPLPPVVKQTLQRVHTLLDQLVPAKAAKASPGREATGSEERRRENRRTDDQIAAETLVTPMSSDALGGEVSDDNCLASGTTPQGGHSAARSSAPAAAGSAAGRNNRRSSNRRDGAPRAQRPRRPSSTEPR
jgi:hypothetical protein